MAVALSQEKLVLYCNLARNSSPKSLMTYHGHFMILYTKYITYFSFKPLLSSRNLDHHPSLHIPWRLTASCFMCCNDIQAHAGNALSHAIKIVKPKGQTTVTYRK